MRNCWFYILIISLLTACNVKQVDPDDVDLGFDYFPVSEGLYRTYQVKEIVLLPLSKDTSNYFLKEVIQEEVNNFDEDSHLLYRYKKLNESDPWVLDSAWSVTRTSNHAIVQENNKRRLYLSFPLSENLEWDYNAYNASAEDNFKVESIGQPYPNPKIPKLHEDVVVIAPTTIRNAISVNDRQFVYQRGIGLIYRYEEITEQQPQQDIFGRIYEAILINSGNE